MDQGFKPLATPGGSAGEYGRVGRGRTDEDKPAELVVMYFSGSVLCQGRDFERAAKLLASIAEGFSTGQSWVKILRFTVSSSVAASMTRSASASAA